MRSLRGSGPGWRKCPGPCHGAPWRSARAEARSVAVVPRNPGAVRQGRQRRVVGSARQQPRASCQEPVEQGPREEPRGQVRQGRHGAAPQTCRKRGVASSGRLAGGRKRLIRARVLLPARRGYSFGGIARGNQWARGAGGKGGSGTNAAVAFRVDRTLPCLALPGRCLLRLRRAEHTARTQKYYARPHAGRRLGGAHAAATPRVRHTACQTWAIVPVECESDAAISVAVVPRCGDERRAGLGGSPAAAAPRVRLRASASRGGADWARVQPPGAEARVLQAARRAHSHRLAASQWSACSSVVENAARAGISYAGAVAGADSARGRAGCSRSTVACMVEGGTAARGLGSRRAWSSSHW